ncbi:MAG: glycosyltransferase family 4 protein [Candidatus Acidiferrales bacterium]
MTVVVNAVSAKMGGGATYLRELVRELADRPLAHRFIFYVPPEQAGLAAGLPGHIEWRVTPVGHAGALRRLWWDQGTLRGLLKRKRADVLLSFADFGQLRCPVLQVLILQNPTYFCRLFRAHVWSRKGWRFRLQFGLRRWLICRSAREANVVMTPSASLVEMVRGVMPLPEDKVMVNHFGAPAHWKDDALPARDYSGTIRLLFPTYYTDHKNFATALEALRLLRQRRGARFRLVTTADPRWELARSTTATWKHDLTLLEELSRQGAVEVVGLLPHDKLLALYRECHVMCYPTLTESFGLPLLEALHAGLPVVASDIAVNHELARDAAVYFDPLDPAQLAARIEEVADNADLRAALQERGRRYAMEFSWARHTDRLIHRLEELAGGPNVRPE